MTMEYASVSIDVKGQFSIFSTMPRFELRGSVGENVLALREALGSATRVLSRDDLAALIGKRHNGRKPNGSTVQRWEEGAEPDIRSIKIMADLARVTFEEFALGRPDAIQEVPAEAFAPAETSETVRTRRRKP